MQSDSCPDPDQDHDFHNRDADQLDGQFIGECEYADSVSEATVLTACQERALAMRIKSGDAIAKQELVVANLALVFSAVRGYGHTGNDVPLDDLIQEGNLGLVRAAETF